MKLAARLVCGGVVVLGLADGARAADVKCAGLELPANSKRVKDAPPEECRFVSSVNWDETMKFFSRGLPSSSTRWHREVNIPAARYRTIESTSPKTGWEGVNIYMLGAEAAGEVRINVVARPQEPAAATPKEDKAKGGKGEKGKKGKGKK